MTLSVKHITVVAVAFTLFFNFSSCNKEDNTILDSNGVAVKLPHLWKTSITDNGNLSYTGIATPIIYDEDKLLVGSTKNLDRAILSLNSSDGSVNWQWNDLLSLQSDPTYKDPIILYTETYHQNNGRLFFNYSTSSYCIELETGETEWKYKSFRARFSRNGGIDNMYFTSGANYDPIDEEKIYFGSMESSNEEQLLLIPEYTLAENPPVNAQGYVKYVRPFKKGGNTYLAFGIDNPSKNFTNEGRGLTELNLYNITQARYEYKKVLINPNRETFGLTHLIYGAPNLYFQSAHYIHSYEAMTGKENWRAFIAGDSPLLSAMLLADNKLFSACEDRFLYCIDANTGRQLWKEQNTGTCSELTYLNGVLYYLGGGDGLLHAVDAETGKHLWKVSSPDLNVNSGAWFYGVCVAVPGKNGSKGVVVATTGLNAYGYEAIR